MMEKKKRHIDDVQPATVDEHFKLLVKDRSTIDPNAGTITIKDLPEWYDEKLFKEGQEYYMHNLVSIGAATLAGLIAILSVPEIIDVLTFTKQSGSTCTAYRRYAQTHYHTYALYNRKITDPKSKYFDTLNVIRWKHSTASKRSKQAGLTGILQRDMVITQFGFVGYSMIQPKILGLTNKPEEREAFNHFWRVTGHLLGISDELNMCRKDPEETSELSQRIATEVLGGYMKNPEERYLQIIRHALNGLWHLDVALDPDAFIALTYRLTGLEYERPLSWYSQCNYKYRELLLSSFNIPYIGPVTKGFFNIYTPIALWMAKVCPFFAWIFLGIENSKINLYPKIKQH